MDLSQVMSDSKWLIHDAKITSPREGRFIYCFTERGDEAHSSCLPAPSDGRQVTGLDGAKLETICYGEIAAVVSSLEATRFDQLEKGAQRESILKHQEVNSRIFLTRTVVPVRFGTVADDPSQVKELMQKIYLQVKAALKRLEKKMELVVRASWDFHSVLESDIPIENSEAADVQQKIAIGRRVFEALDKRKKAITERIQNCLQPLAVEFAPSQPAGTSPQRVPRAGGEEMVFDCSYLVEREREALFDAAVNCLANEYEGRVSFKYIGPLPPYSFARLEVTRGNFEVVDEARMILGLPEKSSFEQIKACYRGLAMAHHPDRNPGDPRAEERFREVAKAYEILETYCENNPRLEDERSYSFSKDAVDSAVIVRSGS